MTRFLVVSIRFLDDRYHGQTAHGEKAEWPPSPFRLFQALVAGNSRGGLVPDAITAALVWLESLAPPVIVAPHATEGLERLTYVINNYSHEDAKSRAPKSVRPTLLDGDRLVEYVWSIEADASATMKAEAIISAAKRVRCLGWGIDMSIGTGSIVATMPTTVVSREVFRPVISENPQGVDLRAPAVGSFRSLERAYSGFISRYETPEITRMEAAEALYQPVTYLADSSRPSAAFRLLDPEAGKPRSYPATRAVAVAGMIRGAAHEVAKNTGRDPKWIGEFVCGHHDGPDSFPRFSYLPLPSIQPIVGVGRISRVLIAEPIGSDGREAAGIKQLLVGQIAKNEQGRDALIVPLADDFVLKQYVTTSQTWTTTTPVALPGSDDGMASKTAKLLDKMLRHAGYSPDVVQDIEYHRVPFRPGAEDAKRYRPRDDHYLANCTMYHMRIHWKFPIRGPIALGAGRHCGLGIFAVGKQ